MTARIFISYSRKDESFARRLATALSELGADVWIDVEDIPAGVKWSSAIQQGLDTGQLLVVVITPDSMASTNVEDEWQYYLDHGKPVIPVLLRPAKTHFQLNRLQYIDFHSQDFDTAFNQFLAELRRKGIELGQAAPTQDVLPPPPVSQRRPADDTPVPPARTRPNRAPLVIGAVVIILALVVVGILLMNGSGQAEDATPTTDQTAIAAADDATATRDATGTPTPAPLVATSTDIPTTPPPTATPTAAATATATLTPAPPSPTPIPLGFPGNPVTSNTGWGPVIRTISGAEMVLVPAGTFMMGASDADLQAGRELCNQVLDSGTCTNLLNDESPQAVISFARPFWIDRTEVTNAAYGSHGTFPGDDLPRTNVTWTQARAHCEQRGARLPTEAEWEYAARGPDSLRYPWGDSFEGTRLNICDAGCEFNWRMNHSDGHAQAAPVSSFPQGMSWVGALDMAGNVWEWTNTLYAYSYPYTTTDGREAYTDTRQRVLRGSSWNWIGAEARTTARSAHANGFPSSDWYGFRCARDYTPGDLD